LRLRIEEIARATGGEVRGGGTPVITGVTTDSRKVNPGELFIALKGPNFDGHAFIKDVFAKGAAAAVVEGTEGLGELPASAVLIVVKDTLKALGALAAYYRGLHKIPVVAITGSAGKTTTKEMIAAILSRSRSVLKTEGNRNNLIGLPLTLLRLDETHEAAVVELGISEDWEMEMLVAICSPDVAVITNIGRGHLKTLGSLDGVAKAKGPLFTLLPQHGVRAVNLDDPWVVKIAGNGSAVTYSLKEKADVMVEGCEAQGGFAGTSVVYSVRGKRVEVRFSTPGITNVINGAAAIAATLPLGVPLDDMAAGLAAYSPVKGRMCVLRLTGITVLDDTYNANPESMASALKTLSLTRGRKVAVLGDMLELGDASDAEHLALGRLAAESGVDALVAIGASSGKTAEGARMAGLKKASSFTSKKEALETLKSILREGDAVLVKGSRGIALEEIVESLKGIAPARAC